MLRDQPPRPANMVHIVAVNRGLEPYATREPQPAALPMRDAAALVGGGHLVVDIRDHESFSAGHIPGAYNVSAASSSFEQSVGWILPAGRKLVLAAESAEAARVGAHKLAFVGLDSLVVGWTSVAAWREGGGPVTGVDWIDVAALERDLASRGIRVLDVREAGEWNAGHIAGALNVSFKQLPQRIETLPLSPDEPVAVTCAGGMRASTACSILLDAGFRDVRIVRGGMSAWRASGLPVVTT